MEQTALWEGTAELETRNRGCMEQGALGQQETYFYVTLYCLIIAFYQVLSISKFFEKESASGWSVGYA